MNRAACGRSVDGRDGLTTADHFCAEIPRQDAKKRGALRQLEIEEDLVKLLSVQSFLTR
jgi:hypothetical protein